MAEWILQFPIEEMRSYAARFVFANDHEVMAIGEAARKRGHYVRDELISVCVWKGGERTRWNAERNTAEAVELKTRVALNGASTERERFNALRELRGVQWATASVFLHLAYPQRYPILDQRVLQSFGVPQPGEYSFRFWEEYLSAWLPLVEESGLDGRSVDRALWQWSKENGEPLRR